MAPPTARLGAALRNRRKSLGLTQQELARLAGCGLAFLYELESGKGGKSSAVNLQTA